MNYVHPAGAIARRKGVRCGAPAHRAKSGIMNRRHIVRAAVVCLLTVSPARALALRCPPDSVKVGNTCVDTYEASLWQIDPANTTLVR